MGHSLKVTARKQAKQREEQAQVTARGMAEWMSSPTMPVPLHILVIPCVSWAGQAYLWSSHPSSVQ